MAMQAFMSRLAAVIATLAVVLASVSIAIALTASSHVNSFAAKSSSTGLPQPMQTNSAAFDLGPALFTFAIAIFALLSILLPRDALPKWARPKASVEPSRLVVVAVVTSIPLFLGVDVVSSSVNSLLTSHDRPIIEQPAFGIIGRSLGISALSLAMLANMITWTRLEPKSMIESPADS